MELEKGPKVSLTLESNTSHSYVALSLHAQTFPRPPLNLLSCQGVGVGEPQEQNREGSLDFACGGVQHGRITDLLSWRCECPGTEHTARGRSRPRPAPVPDVSERTRNPKAGKGPPGRQLQRGGGSEQGLLHGLCLVVPEFP
uniref:Uncharacterized protein n=1 Tax=Myotis myotis TaxID=51298 RepID=A0A7J7VZ06_MYOMY|nr:hypothetical protein mMyoMyo1_012256 [Myotis myotis]